MNLNNVEVYSIRKSEKAESQESEKRQNRVLTSKHNKWANDYRNYGFLFNF